MLALTSRPEPDPIDAAWRAASGGCPLLTLDLAPLTAAEARELAASYGCEDQALVASCVQRAEGNPLFLDQLLRNAISGGRTLPSSIQSIVLARLDRLDPDDRQALQAASILGQRFSVEARAEPDRRWPAPARRWSRRGWCARRSRATSSTTP